jgi:DNA-binding NtrC family response regulator
VRVLLVEDESQVLTLAQSILEQEGHDIISAATVAEAQSVINSDEKFDLVFTDVQLANHADGGLTVGALVGKTRPGTPVLYTSGRPPTDGMQSMFVEPSAYLPKPYTGDELTAAIIDLLGTRR